MSVACALEESKEQLWLKNSTQANIGHEAKTMRQAVNPFTIVGHCSCYRRWTALIGWSRVTSAHNWLSQITSRVSAKWEASCSSGVRLNRWGGACPAHQRPQPAVCQQNMSHTTTSRYFSHVQPNSFEKYSSPFLYLKSVFVSWRHVLASMLLAAPEKN